MDPITPSTAAAGAMVAGQIASAVIGSYRLTSVPRLGRKEDRANAYRRLMDASTASISRTAATASAGSALSWLARLTVAAWMS